MAMLHAARLLLLVLVSSATLTQVLANSETDTFNEADFVAAKPLWNETALPRCVGDYSNMNVGQPKALISILPKAQGVCVRNNGDFVTTIWQPRTFVYMCNSCGWIIKRIELPEGTYGTGCLFTKTNLYYTDEIHRRILQYSVDGTFEKVFATGLPFVRLLALGNNLYSTISHSNMIPVYDTTNGKLVRKFDLTSGHGRGIALDPNGLLHIATFGKTVEIFTRDGHKIGDTITYPEIIFADGLIIDAYGNTIITDVNINNQVLVYNKQNSLIKRITGFHNPRDVAFGKHCEYLLVADLGGGTYLL